MGQSVSKDDFIWAYTEQPHLSRRTAVLKKHPKIKQLYGTDESFKFVVIAMVLFQIFMCWLLQDEDWILIFLEAYVCGGVINHAMTLAIHDISHNTAFGNKYPLWNRFFGMLANLPVGVPFSVSFKKYHVAHHRYLGEEFLLLFSRIEITNMSSTLKSHYFLMEATYHLQKAPNDLEIINAIVQIAFDAFVPHIFGIRSFLYLILGTFVAMGVHPSAGHFISEHYVFKGTQEIYSYYGLWNLYTFNVGYHVENHDFPYIPRRNLPQAGTESIIFFTIVVKKFDQLLTAPCSVLEVTKIALEFYSNLHTRSSWTKVLWDFVFSPDMGPYMRLKRTASVAQTFRPRHALNEYYEAVSKISDVFKFIFY
uniref:Lipid_DES domain-containing protein n=1 Tax=Angiostrongylus cantonensis TaxID=6313 RepID=A0A0K0DD58_ANGCA